MEWLISRVCEEFHCLPADAVRAIDEDEDDLIFPIIELRGFVHAHHDLTTAAETSREISTPSPMHRRVLQLQNDERLRINRERAAAAPKG